MVVTFAITVSTGVLMVSNVRFHSFKELDLRGKVPFVAILVVVLIIVFIAVDPPLVLFGAALVYALSGPSMTLFYIRQRRAARKLSGAGGGAKSDEFDEDGS